MTAPRGRLREVPEPPIDDPEDDDTAGLTGDGAPEDSGAPSIRVDAVEVPVDTNTFGERVRGLVTRAGGPTTTPPKRGRGRPAGSRSKTTTPRAALTVDTTVAREIADGFFVPIIGFGLMLVRVPQDERPTRDECYAAAYPLARIGLRHFSIFHKLSADIIDIAAFIAAIVTYTQRVENERPAREQARAVRAAQAQMAAQQMQMAQSRVPQQVPPQVPPAMQSQPQPHYTGAIPNGNVWNPLAVGATSPAGVSAATVGAGQSYGDAVGNVAIGGQQPGNHHPGTGGAVATGDPIADLFARTVGANG